MWTELESAAQWDQGYLVNITCTSQSSLRRTVLSRSAWLHWVRPSEDAGRHGRALQVTEASVSFSLRTVWSPEERWLVPAGRWDVGAGWVGVTQLETEQKLESDFPDFQIHELFLGPE